MRTASNRGLETAIERVIPALSDNVYISFDIDVLDPGILPATGTPEPGGFDWYEALTVLRKVCEQKRVIGFDLVKLSPIPGSPASDFLAARLVYKFIGYEFKPRD